jgi:hypothetical protein
MSASGPNRGVFGSLSSFLCWHVMTILLDKAIAALEKLPEPEQDAIARELLDGIEADARWQKLLDDPRSIDTLRRLVEEARGEIDQGSVMEADPSDPTPAR